MGQNDYDEETIEYFSKKQQVKSSAPSCAQLTTVAEIGSQSSESLMKDNSMTFVEGKRQKTYAIEIDVRYPSESRKFGQGKNSEVLNKIKLALSQKLNYLTERLDQETDLTSVSRLFDTIAKTQKLYKSM